MRTITLIIVHCSANRQGSTLRMMDITSLSRPMVRSRPVGPLNKWALTVRTTIGTVSGFAISEDSPTMERLPWIPERKPNEKPYRVCFVNCISDSPKP